MNLLGQNSFLAAVSSSAPGAIKYMQVYWWEWLLLGSVVVALIAFDIFGHAKKAHEPTWKEASGWTLFYISLAVIFGISLHIRHVGEFSAEYFAGYLTEYCLSLDNIFVFIIILAAFKVERKYQQKILLYGIMIALILRLVFILLGAALIERFIWVFFIFGGWMLYVAVHQLKEGLEKFQDKPEVQTEYKDNFVTRLAAKILPLDTSYKGGNLVVRKNGKVYATTLMLCIISIGTVDLMFALDSIPAIYGLTKQPFIVFSANAFALLGLRQLFFLIDGLLEKIVFLDFGLAVILGFIAVKIILHAFHGYGLLTFIGEPGTVLSVTVIALTVTITVLFSLISSSKRKKLS